MLQTVMINGGKTRSLPLDHLRALAISMVFVYHYGGLFEHPAWSSTISRNSWWAGVDLFFVLSGFLISSQLFTRIRNGKEIEVGQFYIRRFFRIVPAYVVIVALYFLFPFTREFESPPPLWRFLTFTQNYGLDPFVNRTFTHAWSLCIEEQFYLLFPLVIIVLLKLKKLRAGIVLVLILFVAGLIFRNSAYSNHIEPIKQTDPQWWFSWYSIIYYPTHNRLDGLLAGILLGAFHIFRPVQFRSAEKYKWLLLTAGLVIVYLGTHTDPEQVSRKASVWSFPLVSIGFGLMVWSAALISHRENMFSKVTGFIALLSYPIYLVHKMSIHITQKHLLASGIAADSNLMMLVCIAITIACALILHLAVERPFLRLRTRLLEKKT